MAGASSSGSASVRVSPPLIATTMAQGSGSSHPRGRPPGSGKKKGAATGQDPEVGAGAQAFGGEAPLKRKRGRPLGSKNKPRGGALAGASAGAGGGARESSSTRLVLASERAGVEHSGDLGPGSEALPPRGVAVKVEGGIYNEEVVDFGRVLTQLSLPRHFPRGSFGRVPMELRLRHSGGEEYFGVDAVISPDRVLLSQGWKRFMEVHRLELGWTLRFKWLGEDLFAVFAFDKDGCRHDYLPRLLEPQ